MSRSTPAVARDAYEKLAAPLVGHKRTVSRCDSVSSTWLLRLSVQKSSGKAWHGLRQRFHLKNVGVIFASQKNSNLQWFPIPTSNHHPTRRPRPHSQNHSQSQCPSPKPAQHRRLHYRLTDLPVQLSMTTTSLAIFVSDACGCSGMGETSSSAHRGRPGIYFRRSVLGRRFQRPIADPLRTC